MNIQRIITGGCLFLAMFPTFAANKPTPTVNVISSYTAFKFFAPTATYVNRFYGHTTANFIGGNNYEIKKDWTVGLFLYNTSTDLYLDVNSFLQTSQKTNNNSVFAHTMKKVTQNFYIDTLGGVGQNSINYTTLEPSITRAFYAGSTKSTNWFLMLKALYTRTWNKFSATGSVSGLYNQVNQRAYDYVLDPVLPPLFIDRSTVKATFLLENGELGYKIKPDTQVFINGGLIQPLQVSASTPAAILSSIGTAPADININRNGYLVGAGLSYQFKKLQIRFDQQYSQRGRVYLSNMSILSLKINLE